MAAKAGTELQLPLAACNGEVVVMESATAAALTVIVRLCDATNASAAVALTVKVELPATVGVPLILPVEELMESPVGKEPLEMLQAYGEEPPSAKTVWL